MQRSRSEGGRISDCARGSHQSAGEEEGLWSRGEGSTAASRGQESQSQGYRNLTVQLQIATSSQAVEGQNLSVTERTGEELGRKLVLVYRVKWGPITGCYYTYTFILIEANSHVHF